MTLACMVDSGAGVNPGFIFPDLAAALRACPNV